MFSNLQNRQKPLKLTGFPLLSEVSMQTSGQEIYSPPVFLLIVGTGGAELLPQLQEHKARNSASDGVVG